MDYKARCEAFYKAMQMESNTLQSPTIVYRTQCDDRHTMDYAKPKRHYVRPKVHREMRLSLMTLTDPDNN